MVILICTSLLWVTLSHSRCFFLLCFPDCYMEKSYLNYLLDSGSVWFSPSYASSHTLQEHIKAVPLVQDLLQAEVSMLLPPLMIRWFWSWILILWRCQGKVLIFRIFPMCFSIVLEKRRKGHSTNFLTCWRSPWNLCRCCKYFCLVVFHT